MDSTSSVDEQATGISLAVVGIILHAILVVVLFAYCDARIPNAKKAFAQARFNLPPLSEAVIRSSEWVDRHAVMVIAAVILMGIIDFLLIRWLSRDGPFSVRAVVWVVALAVGLIGLGFIVVYSVEVPWTELINRLKAGHIR
jgi:hypothetical protein